jgi:hypothetical protein
MTVGLGSSYNLLTRENKRPGGWVSCLNWKGTVAYQQDSCVRHKFTNGGSVMKKSALKSGYVAVK